MYNPTQLITIIREIELNLSAISTSRKYVLENNTFSLMINLKKLVLFEKSYGDFTLIKIQNDSLKGLNNLEELKLGNCLIKEANFCFDFPNLKKLELFISFYRTSNVVFSNLSNLVELNFGCDLNCLESDDNLFSNLSNLKILHLKLKNINSNFFKDLTQLKELHITKTNLYENNSTCIIHKDAFKGLVNLIKLKLSNCKFLESNLFEDLISLKKLSLSFSSINLDEQFFNGLSNLERLHLEDINFIHKNEDFFQNLINLKEIKSNLEIISMLPNNRLKNIQKLKILGNYESIQNRLTKIELNNLNCLHLLDIKYDLDLKMFKKLEKLDELKLRIKEDNSSRIESVINFERLSLKHFHMSVNTNLFQDLINLTSLNLSLGSISFHATCDLFSNLSNLKHLDLSSMDRVDLDNKVFSNLSKLEVLSLTMIRDLSINELSFYGLVNLKILNLSYNGLFYLKANILKHMINLVDLNLNSCKLSSIHDNAFNGLSKLQRLNLSLNSIDNISVKDLSQLTSLKYLNLYQNPFIYRMEILKFYNDLNNNDLNLIIDVEE